MNLFTNLLVSCVRLVLLPIFTVYYLFTNKNRGWLLKRAVEYLLCIVFGTILGFIVIAQAGCGDDGGNPPPDTTDVVEDTNQAGDSWQGGDDTTSTTDTTTDEVANPCAEVEVLNGDEWNCCNGSCDWSKCSVVATGSECLVTCDDMVTELPTTYPGWDFSGLPTSFSITYPNDSTDKCSR